MSAPGSGIDVHAYQQRVRGDDDLNSTARLVAFVMSSYAHYGNGRSIRASRETIAKGTGLSVRTVGRAQAQLIQSGYMSLVRDNSRSGTGLVNIHALHLPEWGTEVPPVMAKAEEPVSKAEEPVSKAGERVSHYPAMDLVPYPPNPESSDQEHDGSQGDGAQDATEQAAVLARVEAATSVVALEGLIEENLTRWPSPWAGVLDQACSARGRELIAARAGSAA